MKSKIGNFEQLVCSLNDSALADLLETGREAGQNSTEDLQEQLENLLSLQVGLAINQMPEKQASLLRDHLQQLRDYQASVTGGTVLKEILLSSDPTEASLRFCKQFGKDLIDKSQLRWPHEIGYVIYYAAYASAIVHDQKFPGRLGQEEVLEGFQKLSRHAWIPNPLVGIYRRAERALMQKC